MENIAAMTDWLDIILQKAREDHELFSLMDQKFKISRVDQNMHDGHERQGIWNVRKET